MIQTCQFGNLIIRSFSQFFAAACSSAATTTPTPAIEDLARPCRRSPFIAATSMSAAVALLDGDGALLEASYISSGTRPRPG